MMFSKAFTLGLCVLAIFATATTTAGQELRGRITGVVSDNTGAVLPGVMVTATSPALIQPQTAVTGADGTYRFPALPPGLYAFTFELSGFQSLKHEAIRVGLNQTLSVDAQLQISTLQETVTITGASPVVDVKSTTVGTNFTKELLQDIPNARDIWAAMAQAPGFQMTGYDVGGSHTGTQTGYMFYGTAGQNKTLFEGINVTEGQDANAGYFDFGSFEEFQVGAGAMGEQQGPGALLNITVKSGGDKFGAQLYYDYEDKNTISDNILDDFKVPGGVGPKGFKAPTLRDPATGQLLGLQSGNPIAKQYDFNVNGGGPIRKGKAWFFASYRDNNQYRKILGLPGEEAQSQLLNKTVKGTYQVSKSNQIIYFYNERSKLQPLRDLSLAIPVSAAHYQDSKNRPQKLEWTSVVSSRAFLDLQYSHWGNFFPLYPTQTQSQSLEGVPVGRIDLATQQRSGGMDYYHYRTTLKPQFSGSLSYFLDRLAGTHNLKVGFEAYRERRKFLRFQPGNIYYRDRGPALEAVDIYNTPNEGIDDGKVFGLYVQDEWAPVRRFTINYGVRFDRYTLGWPEQSFTPEQTSYFRSVTTSATDVAQFKSFSPRVGVAWDVVGDGKSVVKVHFGRYYFNPSTDISSLENPVGQAAIRYEFFSCTATRTTNCDLNGNRLVDSPSELGNRLETIGGAGFVTIDRDIKHPYGQGVTTSFERQLAERLSARTSYVFKQQRQGWGEVDLARYNAYTIPVTFVDVGADNIAGTGDDQTLNLLDRPAGIAEQRFFTTPNKFGLPEVTGDYHTIEFALNRRFNERWLLMTSFEHTWADDFRNTNAGTGNLDVARQATFGPLANAYRTIIWNPNRRAQARQESSYWNYKLIGRYVFPYEIAVSSSYKLQSGFNWARAISVPATTLRGAGAEEILAEPLKSNRTENVHILDFRFEKAFKLGRIGRVAGMMDVFNITNANPITNFRLVTGTRFKEVISILDPRIVRFGVRYDF